MTFHCRSLSIHLFCINVKISNETCRFQRICSRVNNSNAGNSSSFLEFFNRLRSFIKLFLFRIFTNKFDSVSSVWNKEVKQHGKSFMFDGEEDTAWYSDQVSLSFGFHLFPQITINNNFFAFARDYHKV